jgi:hypothetical protein
MEDFLKVINKQCDCLAGIASRIGNYAKSFQAIGNDKLSQELWTIVYELNACQKTIQQEVGKDIDRQFKQAQQSSATVLKAALAGIAVAKKDRDTASIVAEEFVRAAEKDGFKRGDK